MPGPGLVLALVLASAPVDGGRPPAAGSRTATKPARTVEQVRVLYFHASWCRSCRAFEAQRVLERLQQRVPGLVVERVDVDRAEALVERYGVEFTPALRLVDEGGFPLARLDVELADAEATLARAVRLVQKMTPGTVPAPEVTP